jgi:hypothetical protein
MPAETHPDNKDLPKRLFVAFAKRIHDSSDWFALDRPTIDFKDAKAAVLRDQQTVQTDPNNWEYRIQEYTLVPPLSECFDKFVCCVHEPEERT